MQRSALCRSRRELSNEYLLAKIGVDTAENEPLKVWRKIQARRAASEEAAEPRRCCRWRNPSRSSSSLVRCFLFTFTSLSYENLSDLRRHPPRRNSPDSQENRKNLPPFGELAIRCFLMFSFFFVSTLLIGPKFEASQEDF